MQEFDKKLVYAHESEWQCYSTKAIKKKYQGSNYQIVGEVTKKYGKYRENLIKNENDQILFIQPTGTYSHLLYRPYAYIPIENDSYIVVKKSNVLFLIILFMMITLMVVGLLWKYTGGPTLDPNAEAYKSSLKRPADWDSSSILIPGYDKIKMTAGEDELNIILTNPEKNPCYFKFSIMLDKNKEMIYSSGLIKPGHAVKKPKLTKAITEGTHPITIKVETYSLDNYEVSLNGGEVKTNIEAIPK